MMYLNDKLMRIYDIQGKQAWSCEFLSRRQQLVHCVIESGQATLTSRPEFPKGHSLGLYNVSAPY